MQKPLTGKHVLFYLVLFFGVVFIANGIMITNALESNPGVITEHPYERGLAYDDVLAQADFQKKLGWTTDLAVANVPEGKKGMAYTVRDPAGAFVTGKTVAVRMVRPVRDGYDFDVKLEQGPDGIYRGTFTPPLKGAWEANISMTWDGGVYYDKVPLVIE